jgi:uncharacterized protein (TIGR03437 family)
MGLFFQRRGVVPSTFAEEHMDAAHTPLRKTVLLLPLALFAMAPVIQAQTITAAPSSLSLSAAAGSSLSAIVFLSTASTTGVSFSVTADQSWLTVSVPANTVSSASFVQLTVIANAANLAGSTTPYTGHLIVTPAGGTGTIIPVTFTVTGGGGTGTLTATPNPINLSFTPGSGLFPNAFVSLQSSTGAATFTTSTTSSNGWLLASPSGSISGGFFVTVSGNIDSLPTGFTRGTILVTDSNNATVTIQVNLTVNGGSGGGGSVTVSPATLSFTGQAGAGILAGQALTITSPTSSVNVTVSTSGGSWLSTSVPSGATPLPLTVNVDVTGLSPATYPGSIIITPAGGTAVTVRVTLTVTTLPAVSATPTSLAFTYRVGDVPPASQPVSVTGAGSSLSFTATASSSGGWLSVLPVSGTATPDTLAVSVSPANLSPSPTPYAGTITVSGGVGATGSTIITVSLSVTQPLPTVNAVTNAGSFLSGSISPGEVITLFGTSIGPATAVGTALDTTGKVATTIGGVQVLVNGFPSPMIFASALQVSAVVPYEIAGFVSADVLVKFLDQTSNAVHLNVATTAPGLFTANSSGKGPGAILNPNNSDGSPSFNSPSNPAAKGDIVSVYLTGEGQTNPKGVTGKVTTVSTTLPLTPVPLLPVSVLIGPAGAQQSANFTFAGEAPGIVSGVMQLNVQIPATVASGDAPIVVSIGGNRSQDGVTVSVK